jgi:hypothetical protein
MAVMGNRMGSVFYFNRKECIESKEYLTRKHEGAKRYYENGHSAQRGAESQNDTSRFAFFAPSREVKPLGLRYASSQYLQH